MQEYEIEFYDKADGSEPAKEFILSLDKKCKPKFCVPLRCSVRRDHF